MLFGKKLPLTILSLIVFTPTMFGIAQAKSLYVITDRNSKVKAYDIQDYHLTHQTYAENLGHHSDGAVGLALDPCSATLFVTYEASNVIEMVNARTMISEQKPLTIYGTSDLAGIVFDQTRQKLYVVKRQDDRLYVYLWYPATRTLTLEGGTYKTLEDIGSYPDGAYGLALDESNYRLYVTNGTNTVRYYDANDPNFAYEGSIDIVVNSNGREAVGIAIDPNRQYLYTGAFTGITGQHNFLVRTDLSDPNDPNSYTEKNVGEDARVIGIAADQQTGLVYATIYYEDCIEVYDTTTFPSDPCHTQTAGISGPADICLAGDVSYKPPAFILEKDYALEPNDPNACVLPGYYITYTITYDANGHEADNVNIVDYLPPETDFNSADSNGVYDANQHTVTWHIGTLSPSDANSVTLTVRVSELAEPLGTVTNYCEIESDLFCTPVKVDVPVCFWVPDPAVIYVDKDAPGSDTGMSWYNAYHDLQDALERAAAGCGSQIRVAEGIYTPDTEPNYNAAFELIDGVALYGGFAGFGEPNPDDRCPNTYETILTGSIAGGYNVNYVVTASDVNETAIIDGFIIEMAWHAGVYCDGSSPTIKNNKITDNKYYGIYCQNCNGSSVNITNCQILNCGEPYVDGGGIYCYNSNLNIIDCFIDNIRRGNGIHCENDSSVTVRNTEIQNNTQNQNTADNGIYCYQSNLNVINCTIKDSCDYGIHCREGYSVSITNSRICGNFNNWDGIYIQQGMGPTIKNNCICDYHRHGISFLYTSTAPLVRNNTIVDNQTCGITRSGGAYPNITNCVIWRNEDDQLNGCTAAYSCIQDCNYAADPHMHNICADPCLIDYDPNGPGNYHIDPNSPCFNTGDPNANYGAETDIDGEPRVANGRVDMGADEYYWSHADFNDDGIVNFFDYALLAAAWLTDDPNYSLDDDNDVDINDLALFCGDWLWIAAWAQSEWMMMGQGEGGSGQDLGLEQEPDVQEPVVEEPDVADTEEPLVEESDVEEPEVEEFDIEEMVSWLEELWLTDEQLRQTTTEQEWLDFIERVKQTPSY